MESFAVVIPGGLMANGSRYQDAELRPITGADEVFLMDARETHPPAQLVTALLSKCLIRLGPYDKIDEEIVRSLIVGDRESLLLNLQRITWGELMECVLNCPNPECREKMDLNLKVSDLLVPPYPEIRDVYEIVLSDNGNSCKIQFRLLRGSDQEAAADLAHRDLNAAANLLINRCLVSREGECRDNSGILTLEFAQKISSLMADLDRQALMTLNFSCPFCRMEIATNFDIASYLFREIESRKKSLYREVHTLAFHYHWSEAEIMSLTPKKRYTYLQLLDQELANGGRM